MHPFLRKGALGTNGLRTVTTFLKIWIKEFRRYSAKKHLVVSSELLKVKQRSLIYCYATKLKPLYFNLKLRVTLTLITCEFLFHFTLNAGIGGPKKLNLLFPSVEQIFL